MLDIFGITIAVYLFLFMMGWGVGLLALPIELKKYQLWLAPWLGMIVIGMSSIWLSRFGLGTEISLYFILLIGIAAIGFCRFKGLTLIPSFRISDGVIAASVLLSLYLALSPLVSVEGFPTTISMGNSDPHNYAVMGDFLKTHGIYQKPTAVDLQPNAYQISELLGPGIRPSCWLLYSVLSLLVSHPTHEIFTTSLAVFFALTPPLVAIFTKVISRDSFAAGVALLISTLNINFLYFNYHGFGAQIPAQGLLIFGFTLLYLIDFSTLRYCNFIFPIAIVVSTLFTFYAEMAPFLLLPSFMYIGLLLCSKLREESSDLSIYLRRIGLMIIGSIIIDPIAVNDGLNWLSRTSNAPAGWPMLRWATPADMLGFFNVYPGSLDLSTVWPFVTSIPIVGCMILGARSLKNRDFTLAYLIFTIGIFLYLRYWRIYSYGYHKAIVFSLFFFIALFASGLAIAIQKIARYFKWTTTRLKIIQIGILIALSPVLLQGIMPTVKAMNQNHLAVDRSLSDLSQLRIDLSRKIYLGETQTWKQMWITKFLGDRPIAFPTHSPYYGDNKFLDKIVPPNSLYLTPSQKPLISQEGDSAKIIWTNNVYYLKETEKQQAVELVPDQNWNYLEKSWIKNSLSDEFCWLEQDATLKILRHLPTISRTELEFKFVTLLPQTTVEFYVDNQLTVIQQIQNLKPYRLSIPLSGKVAILKIHVREGEINPPGDYRSMAVGVSSIRFTSQ